MTLFAISYLAGVLTIVSPCIVPILPFVLSRADQPFIRRGLPILIGMAVTCSTVASLVAVGGSWAVQASEIGRSAAIALLGVCGVTLISPRAAAFVTRSVVAVGDRLSGSGVTGRQSIGGALLLGVATGLLWAPCAGPVLGVVLIGAVLHGAGAQTAVLLLAYAAGAATWLAVTTLAGGRIIAVMMRSSRLVERIRQGIGVAVLAGVLGLAFDLDHGVLRQLSVAGTEGIEQTLLDGWAGGDATVPARRGLAANGGSPGIGDPLKRYRSSLPDRGAAPSLEGIVTWLNPGPSAAEQLRGKVVLVNFWTYSCINCIRTLPYVRAWAEKYKDQGLAVIGVHTPEFAFEKQVDNVKQAVARFGISYPVAIDNDFRIWRSFGNGYWPALYLIDAQGRIRYHQFGEGDEARSEQAIQELLAERGSLAAGGRFTRPDANGAQAPADVMHLRSEETYLGYRQASGFASREDVAADRPQEYSIRALRLNQWGLTGNWTVGADGAILNRAEGGIAFRFSARDLHLVLGPGSAGKPVRFRVTIDGAAPAADRGADIDADGNGTIQETRLYQMVRQTGDVRERSFEIHFFEPGVQAFAFTFG